jgi:hypothetical protein
VVTWADKLMTLILEVAFVVGVIAVGEGLRRLHRVLVRGHL